MALSDIPIVNEILTDLVATYSGEMISVYGIGSFFDSHLPSDWIKTDVDFIVIVNTLDNPEIPKYDYTNARFKNYTIGKYDISLGFNTIAGLQNKKQFQIESCANYEWALQDLKLPANSVHLLGKDIRSLLPEITGVYDYDDILARSLYHLNRSLKIEYKSGEEPKKAFTKAVFKFCLYLCLYFDKSFTSTSIKSISIKIQKVIEDKKIDDMIMTFLKETILYRRGIGFKTDYFVLRNNFIGYIFSLLGKGILHRKMNFQELVDYLDNTFGGLKHLKEFAYSIRKRYYAKKLKKIEKKK